MSSEVLVFFYGGLINPRMLARVAMNPAHRENATLAGFELTIRPYVNLRVCETGTTFGQLMRVSHEDLERVYAQLKVKYLPYPVLALSAEGRHVPALCYIAGEMPDAVAERDHVMMLLETAQQLAFPSWYLERIRGFLPPS